MSLPASPPPPGWRPDAPRRRSANRYSVTGTLFGADDAPLHALRGAWNSHMSSSRCDAEGAVPEDATWTELWRASVMPAGDGFGFTTFAHTLNSCAAPSLPAVPPRHHPAALRRAPTGAEAVRLRRRADLSWLRPTCCRPTRVCGRTARHVRRMSAACPPRPGLPFERARALWRQALEAGELGKAGAAKHELEEQQRAERRRREEEGAEWTPRWFRARPLQLEGGGGKGTIGFTARCVRRPGRSAAAARRAGGGGGGQQRGD